MIVTATRVEALPIGVRLPPRLAPKTTAHHNAELLSTPCAPKICASIAANGATTLTLAGQDGSNIMEGFFNQDASLGVFTTRWVPQGGDPNELGLVVLIDVTE